MFLVFFVDFFHDRMPSIIPSLAVKNPDWGCKSWEHEKIRIHKEKQGEGKLPLNLAQR